MFFRRSRAHVPPTGSCLLRRQPACDPAFMMDHFDKLAKINRLTANRTDFLMLTDSAFRLTDGMATDA